MKKILTVLTLILATSTAIFVGCKSTPKQQEAEAPPTPIVSETPAITAKQVQEVENEKQPVVRKKKSKKSTRSKH